jgi:hypothetical protein
MGGLDQPRYLGRTIGYANHPTIDAIECVDEGELRRQTARAHLRAKRRLQDEWARASGVIAPALDEFAKAASTDRQVMRDLGAVRRSVTRLGRHLGL